MIRIGKTGVSHGFFQGPGTLLKTYPVEIQAAADVLVPLLTSYRLVFNVNNLETSQSVNSHRVNRTSMLLSAVLARFYTSTIDMFR